MFRGSFIANDDVCHAAIAIAIIITMLLLRLMMMMMMMICAQGDLRPNEA